MIENRKCVLNDCVYNKSQFCHCRDHTTLSYVVGHCNNYHQRSETDDCKCTEAGKQTEHTIDITPTMTVKPRTYIKETNRWLDEYCLVSKDEMYGLLKTLDVIIKQFENLADYINNMSVIIQDEDPV